MSTAVSLISEDKKKKERSQANFFLLASR